LRRGSKKYRGENHARRFPYFARHTACAGWQIRDELRSSTRRNYLPERRFRAKTDRLICKNC
jgi:hypothetical protein